MHAGPTEPQRVALPALGGIELWVLAVPPADPGELAKVFEELQAQYVLGAGMPIGLGVLVGDELRRRRPEAVWERPRLVYAGYDDADRQLRIAYFAGARLGPGDEPMPEGPPTLGAPPSGVRIGTLAETGLDEDAVLDLWLREAGLSEQEARRRLGEVLTVAVDEDGTLLGVGTGYLDRSPQLGMDLWALRVFVAAAARRASLAGALTLAGGDRLRDRFVRGEDPRGAGILHELQHAGIAQRFDAARWPRMGFDYIGRSAGGHPVRVQFFPGARAPEPPQRPTGAR